MRLNIGICDDFPEQVALLSAYLNRRHDSGAFQIVTGTEPLRFLEDLENTPPQLVFLDIDMGETSGIRLGEAIKSRYPDTLIIYITAYSKYACDAFGVRAFHYLLKPLTEETLSQVLTEALDYIEKRRNGIPVKTLTIRNKGETVSLRYDNIYYFEKAGHRISVHT
ncbi:MAG: LytR/AlgR family response regulator transcription factor, partial [Oscillospiraceae bacterium]